MITVKIMLSENQDGSAPFNKVYLDSLPSIPRVGETLQFGAEEYIVFKLVHNIPMKSILLMAKRIIYQE